MNRSWLWLSFVSLITAMTSFSCENCEVSGDDDAEDAVDISLPVRGDDGLQVITYLSEYVETGGRPPMGRLILRDQAINVNQLCVLNDDETSISIEEIGIRENENQPCIPYRNFLHSATGRMVFGNIMTSLFRDMQEVDDDILGIMHYFKLLFEYVAGKGYYESSRRVLRERIVNIEGDMSPRVAAYRLLTEFSMILNEPPENAEEERFELSLAISAYRDPRLRIGALRYMAEMINEPLGALLLSLSLTLPVRNSIDEELTNIERVRRSDNSFEVLLRGEDNWISSAEFYAQRINCLPELINFRRVRGFVMVSLALSMGDHIVNQTTEGDVIYNLRNRDMSEEGDFGCIEIPENNTDEQITGLKLIGLMMKTRQGFVEDDLSNYRNGEATLGRFDEAVLSDEGENGVVSYMQARALQIFINFNNLEQFVEAELERRAE